MANFFRLRQRRPSMEHRRKMKEYLYASQKSIFASALNFKDSIAPQALPSLLILAVWTALFAVLNKQFNAQITLASSLITLLSTVLSLLLSFRSNQSYDRFSEGRRLWGQLTAQLRNISRAGVTGLSVTRTAESHKRAQKIISFCVAYAYAVKHYLRAEFDPSQWADMAEYMEVLDFAAVSTKPKTAAKDLVEMADDSGLVARQIANTGETELVSEHPEKLPFRIAQALSRHLSLCVQDGLATLLPHIQGCENVLAQVVETTGSLERIACTPVPKPYNILLRQMLLIYCFCLPFQLYKDLGYWMIPVIFLVSYCLIGVEMIARQIEMPFGFDASDINLDELCHSFKVEMKILAASYV
ncbi:UPF0187-domain-containing protein [Gonapodya prolifera JEL478]|uniref:UPF0187-domain-containing protein n=1 Tax=Gonapodya prolifera (strain JEL478) TaxID=1344416 RepID=A0A139AZR5_GONPJ|nr:UPF0187-domain-containing protein [Gonapodya prolifera JEL478]|eukprot:KXS22219.1 UPF0187-domain-containing protein [Gonapodya prolifera JEL478]